MRTVTTAIGTEASQNSSVDRHGVGRGLGWSSGQGVCCAGPKASVTGKGSSTGVEGIRLGVSKVVVSVGAALVPAAVLVLMLRSRRGEMAPASSFVP